MRNALKIGEFELLWLTGGSFAMDAGVTFGPVPKLLWEKKLPYDRDNFVQVPVSPILVKTPEKLVLIESGLGNKLTEKQKKIFRTRDTWKVPEDLHAQGMRCEHVDYVILTHYDWDHSAGVVMQEGQDLKLTFPQAKHILQKTEWKDVLEPNTRSVHTYWPINIETLKKSGNLELVDGEAEIIPGIKTLLTGGHTRGHQIVLMESQGEKAVHLGDLLPTHAHFNPLWITAYDNFPLDSIRMKERYVKQCVAEGAWFIFYQDPIYLACKFDEKGTVVDAVKA
jgi:glyoxylase-like metal-dependent hydrolase (beta-lactamase superfamily II)